MRRSRRPSLALLLAWALGAPFAVAQGPVVRVRAETRIGLQVEPDGSALELRGTLRDDRGEGLAGEWLELRLEGARTRTERLQTNATGGFGLRVDDASDVRAVEVLFGESAWYEGRRVRRRVTPGLVDVRLQFGKTGDGRVDLDGPPVHVSINAESDRGEANLEVVLEDELGRRLAAGRTDERGRVAFSVPAEAMGSVGPGRLVAKALDDDRRAAATSEQPVLRFRRTKARLDQAPGRATPGHPVRVSGRLVFLREPQRGVPEAPVGVYVDDAHVGTVMTDADGTFVLEAPLPDAPEGPRTLIARYDGPRPGLEPSASEPVRIDWTRSANRWWAALAFAMCGIAVALLVLRRKPAARDPRLSVPGVRLGRRTLLPHRQLSGRVVAATDGRPLADAQASLSRPGQTDAAALGVDAEGRFASGDLEPGEWSVRVEAPGHGARVDRVVIPHRGEWNGIEVGLEDLRAVALGFFRDAVRPRLARPDRWDVHTNHEIVQHLGSDAALVGVEARVEAIYYGAEPPTPDAVSDIARAAERLGDAPPSAPPEARGEAEPRPAAGARPPPR